MPIMSHNEFSKAHYLALRDYADGLPDDSIYKTSRKEVNLSDGVFKCKLEKVNFDLSKQFGLEFNRYRLKSNQGEGLSVTTGYDASNVKGYELVSEYNDKDNHLVHLCEDHCEIEIMKQIANYANEEITFDLTPTKASISKSGEKEDLGPAVRLSSIVVYIPRVDGTTSAEANAQFIIKPSQPVSTISPGKLEVKPEFFSKPIVVEPTNKPILSQKKNPEKLSDDAVSKIVQNVNQKDSQRDGFMSDRDHSVGNKLHSEKVIEVHPVPPILLKKILKAKVAPEKQVPILSSTNSSSKVRSNSGTPTKPLQNSIGNFSIQQPIHPAVSVTTKTFLEPKVSLENIGVPSLKKVSERLGGVKKPYAPLLSSQNKTPKPAALRGFKF
jgi:hypothetical protein